MRQDADRGLRGVHGHIVEQLGRSIVNGDIAAGSVLPSEAAMLERFAVSRTVLREALRVLGAKGLVESRQKVGTRVRNTAAWSLLDPDVMSWLEARSLTPELRDRLLEFRCIFEPAAAAMAALRATAGDREALAEAVARMKRAINDPAEYFEADLDFHKHLFAATGNPFLVSLGHAVLGLLAFSFKLQQHPLLSWKIGLRMHTLVLRAILAGDPAAASAAMLDLINRAGSELDDFMRSAGDPNGP